MKYFYNFRMFTEHMKKDLCIKMHGNIIINQSSEIMFLLCGSFVVVTHRISFQYFCNNYEINAIFWKFSDPDPKHYSGSIWLDPDPNPDPIFRTRTRYFRTRYVGPGPGPERPDKSGPDTSLVISITYDYVTT